MNRLINAIYAQYLKMHQKQIKDFIEHPHETQWAQLKSIVTKAKNTEWGRRYQFERVKAPKDWSSLLPVQDYDTIKNDIHRMMVGDENVLWPGRVRCYAKSSGTTSDKSKYIPVTNENHQKCHVRGGWRLLALMYQNLKNPRVIDGKSIILAGSYSQDLPEFPGSLVGDVSAVILHKTPHIAQQCMTPKVEISLMPDFEKKLEIIAQKSIHQDIRLVAGTPTWAVVLFKRILEITGKSNILEVWPNIQIFVHGAVSFVPYREPFRQFFPSETFAYQETYNASEGYFAVQDVFAQDDMLLILDNAVFYEFIPMEEWHVEDPKTVMLYEVELGKNYAIVITTNSGLYRYKIGDTVMFTSLNPYRIKITGRTKQFINAFGEEVMVSNTDAAVAMTCEAFNVKVVDYTVAPVFLTASGKGGHEWVIEFEEDPANAEAFTKILDDNLKKVNSDYEAKRFNDLALVQLKLNIVPKGRFFEWMKSRNKIGAQQKVPRLSNQRNYIEEILKMK
ncbi:MAG: GH3 auxin-responsive promoter family protein [Bacteroidota bacterium]|nr:GH3 auxin-responsive promoter family protein [Bacteroidota bacterium]